MKITKLGHCCLVIETKGKRIMTDPGSYSIMQNEQKNIDVILITHEHPDHLHIESLKTVIMNNPDAIIVTNTAVGKILDTENIKYQIVEDKGSGMIKDILIEGFGSEHAEIYKTWGSVQNTGYFIESKMFYPGDAFYNPMKPVDILALPVAGPWMKISEAVEYALSVKPRIAFPVHDGILKNTGMGHRVPGKILPENNIEFIPMNEGDIHEF